MYFKMYMDSIYVYMDFESIFDAGVKKLFGKQFII